MDYLKNNYLIFDGAMGSLLQQNGLKAGDIPEAMNLNKPLVIQEIHYQYLKSGSNIILTNTFGANPVKIKDNLELIIKAAIANARHAITKYQKETNKPAFLAYDIGPLGVMLEPSGTLKFEEAYEAFKRIVLAVNEDDIDVFVVETISDLYEAKAAILAIKEHSNKPIFVTHTLEKDGTTLNGNSILSIISTLEALQVDALGINCGFGPQEMIALMKIFKEYSSSYLMVQPNAGLPIIKDNNINYDIDEVTFLTYMKEIIALDVQIVGGCCGTNYQHIALLSEYLKDKHPQQPTTKELSICSSATKSVIFNDNFIKVGERINPTNKKGLKDALLNHNDAYLIKEALLQEEEGADVIDINVSIPQTDETYLMETTIKKIQAYVRCPLQIDSTNPKTIEKALRIINGKPIINSISAKQADLDAILPLAKKYGAMIIGLCIDEDGLALSLDDKLKQATKIVNECLKYGIPKKDIMIDCLMLTASAQQKEVINTLQALELIKNKLHVKTILGISNVSFGLANRELINATFLNMALVKGLDAGIINTGSKDLMASLSASNVLLNVDKDAQTYLSLFQHNENIKNRDNKQELSLRDSIIKGLVEDTIIKVEQELMTREPLDIINNDIITTLNYIGNEFENKRIYLPQLIQSAQCVSQSFEIIKKQLKQFDYQKAAVPIILATVKDDVHDIGKNIVKIILESYGYAVIDLGCNVDSTTIINNIKANDVKVVGLSALISTTIINMENTIKKIKAYDSNIIIMVGGAILTKDLAQAIQADYYCKDALEAIKVLQNI